MEPTPPAQPLAIRLDTGQTLHAAPGQTLWQALQQAGVPWPVSCRNGTCRACIGRLAAGRVRYTVEWPGLLPEEKATGSVLPCVACAETDVVLCGPGA
jgi:ferredoxin